jgi:hypothetical protein
VSPRSGLSGCLEGKVEGFAFTAAFVWAGYWRRSWWFLLVMNWLMEQAIFENKIRNLLWLLRSAAPSCQVFGLDEWSHAPLLREQPTAEMGVNGISQVEGGDQFWRLGPEAGR